jgi:hypothetical protein
MPTRRVKQVFEGTAHRDGDANTDTYGSSDADAIDR